MTAKNDITNDNIVSGKGSAEAYSRGWELLFGKKTFAEINEQQPLENDVLPQGMIEDEV